MNLKEERMPFEGNLNTQVRKDQDVSAQEKKDELKKQQEGVQAGLSFSRGELKRKSSCSWIRLRYWMGNCKIHEYLLERRECR